MTLPRARTRFLLALALASALAACASTEGAGSKLVWVRAGDGRPAEHAALEAAKQSCAQTTDPAPGGVNRHYAHIEYTAPIVDCMRGKGYRLVDVAQP